MNTATQTEARLGEYVKEKWESKVMHDQYIITIDRQLISEDVFLWLSRGQLKAETEIVAAQDRALQQNIMQQKHYTETDSKCRVCQNFAR